MGFAEGDCSITNFDLNFELCAKRVNFALDVFEVALCFGDMLQAERTVLLTVDAGLVEQNPMKHIFAIGGIEASEAERRSGAC